MAEFPVMTVTEALKLLRQLPTSSIKASRIPLAFKDSAKKAGSELLAKAICEEARRSEVVVIVALVPKAKVEALLR